MANHRSAEKRDRQNQKRRARNAALRSRMRTFLKQARSAISENAEDRDDAVQTAVREIYRAASKKVLKRRTASRTVSRLMKAAQGR